MRIVLSSERMAFVAEYGPLRYGQAQRRGVENYGRIGGERRETGVQAHDHGLLGEAAVVDAVGENNVALWNFFVDGARVNLQTLPEIVLKNGTEMDAKAISENHLSLVIQKGTVKPNWAYVLVGVQHAPICEIFSFMWGRDVLTVPTCEPQPNRPAHLIRQGDPRLRPFEEFVSEQKLIAISNPFFGRCACGIPGLYYAAGKWFCEMHRVRG